MNYLADDYSYIHRRMEELRGEKDAFSVSMDQPTGPFVWRCFVHPRIRPIVTKPECDEGERSYSDFNPFETPLHRMMDAINLSALDVDEIATVANMPLYLIDSTTGTFANRYINITKVLCRLRVAQII